MKRWINFKKGLLGFVLLVAFLAAAGCGQGSSQNQADNPGEGGNKTEQRDIKKKAENTDLNSDIADDAGAQENAAVIPADKAAGDKTQTVEPPENTTGADHGEDLVIKSDNRVSAGSGQALVNEMDKEINKLVESLENLDTISESDLEVE